MKRRFSILFVAAVLACAWIGQSRVEGDLKVGDLAPDFSLEPRGGGSRITLSSFRGKSPVALVFGSYT